MLDKVGSLFLDRVALPILNMSITAGIIILIVLLVRVLLKKAPKIFSYALWGVVLFRLLCPISFSSSVSVFNLLNYHKENFSEMTFVVKDKMSDVEEGNQDQNTNLKPYIPDYVGANGIESLDGKTFEGNLLENDADKITNEIIDDDSAVMNDSEVDENHDNQLASPAESVTHNQQIFSWICFFCVIWILGIVALSSSNAIRYIRLRKRVSASLLLRENIYLCDEIQVPFCLGVIHPKIYLPSGLGKEEMKYIILHEKHHIKRFDYVVKLLAFIALCIHWLNPLVWVAFVLVGRDMEMSCDEAIMRKMDKDIRVQYSASLLHLATGRRVFTSSTLSFGEGNPKQRIKNIMNYKKPAFWVIVLSFTGCIAVSVTLLSNPIIKEDTIPSENEMMKESINQSKESQQNPVSPNETTEPEYETVPKESDKIKYESNNIRFEYPNTWELKELQHEDGKEISFSNQEGEKVLWIERGEAWRVNLEMDEEDYKVVLSEIYDEVKIEELSKTNIDGYEANTLIFSYNCDGIEKTIKRYTVIVGYAFWEINISSNMSDEEITSFVDSFEFIEGLTKTKETIHVFTQEDVRVIPEVAEYAFEDAYKKGQVQEMEGMVPGTSEGIWYTIIIDGIEYYYAKYISLGEEIIVYYGYSIISDQYSLANGITVGMKQEEILAKYPNMAVMDFEGNYLNEEVTGYQGWNSAAYPGGFETRFDYIMIADIDLGTYDTLPIYVGLLMKDDVVSAITFYYPTAG